VNTVGRIAEASDSLKIPSLLRPDLGIVAVLAGILPVQCAEGCFSRMKKPRKAKDNTAEQWEPACILWEDKFLPA
jgi:phosphopentomutase